MIAARDLGKLKTWSQAVAAAVGGLAAAGAWTRRGRVVGAARRARADVGLRARLRARRAERPARPRRGLSVGGLPLDGRGVPPSGGVPGVECGPGGEVVGEPAEPVLDLRADGEGAVHAVDAVGRSLVFVAANAHIPCATHERPPRLRLERLLEPSEPPRIGLGRRRHSDRGDGRDDLGRLLGPHLDLVHAARLAQQPKKERDIPSTPGGFRPPRGQTKFGMPATIRPQPPCPPRGGMAGADRPSTVSRSRDSA